MEWNELKNKVTSEELELILNAFEDSAKFQALALDTGDSAVDWNGCNETHMEDSYYNEAEWITLRQSLGVTNE